MKSQMIGDENTRLFLFEADGKTIRAEFLDAAGQSVLDPPLGLDKFPGAGFERQLFAVGGDRANATPLVSMFNTLLLREHNRLAAELEKRNPGWDDERLFQTARNILIAMYIKIVIEEYINHISSACFRLAAHTGSSLDRRRWNRANWMTVEFALLYRWHSLIPDRIAWDGAEIDASQMVLDNRFLTSVGLAKGFQFTSAQNATAIGPPQHRVIPGARGRSRPEPGAQHEGAAVQCLSGSHEHEPGHLVRPDHGRSQTAAGTEGRLRHAGRARILHRAVRRGRQSQHPPPCRASWGPWWRWTRSPRR